MCRGGNHGYEWTLDSSITDTIDNVNIVMNTDDDRSQQYNCDLNDTFTQDGKTTPFNTSTRSFDDNDNRIFIKANSDSTSNLKNLKNAVNVESIHINWPL
jgi:hypothetical protein